ncbi:carbohydrate binding domain-containing protein [Actinoplanes sp. NPDC051861]|uniref:carbohydrate binding domain-containing protein n=1 Tax=Actinoplanes sp. NPDC051861 TaxID=3155170 RepID=UPI0034216349
MSRRLRRALAVLCAVPLLLTAAPMAAQAANQVTVYYKPSAGWTTVNIHYAPTGGSWTTVPGVAMTADSCAGWYRKDIDLGTATGLQLVFNNGSGTWDNNGGTNYSAGTGTVTVSGGAVGSAVPCSTAVNSATVYYKSSWTTTYLHYAPTGAAWTTAPGVVMNEEACAGWVRKTVSLGTATSWAATFNNGSGTWDNNSGRNYALGAGITTVNAGVVTANAASPCVTPSPSPTVSPTPTPTPTASPTTPATEGEMLGGDPRKDSIYFVLTARFYDGDAANNRGGSQHTKSGNAANLDPMFRGDFKGLVDKLDYIKALGFSAIWITPVVLNRSDYDYHGYHGWDFYEVDPRLESDGASYQNLIDTAHAKGLKIYQDVVFNHTSRWGAKNLFTPTVYGVRDSQWSWYYSEKVAGKAYNPLEEDSAGRTYNGDLWSSTAPSGNTCPNYGTPTGGKSPEGYTLYHCQWPSPTAKMFPADLFHQCWIGNWEGEDARSCWLHEDLADLNTENATVQNYLIGAYKKYIDMGVDGFRIDTAVHIPRVTWNRRLLPALQSHLVGKYGATKAKDFYIFGEVAAFVNDKWNRGSVNHSAQFFTWKERTTYSADDTAAALEQFNYENNLGTGNQPTSTNAFLSGNAYHAPDHSQFSGMNIIDMRMHMNFGDASNAFHNGKDSDDSVNDATYNVVYVDSHDYGPNKSSVRYAEGTDAWAENMSLMWTFRGIPTLYYGSEIEFKAGQKIDCGPSCPLETTGRAYYGSHLAGSVTASDFGVVGSASGTVATTLSKPLVKHVQRLNQIRRAVPALQMGQYSTEGVSGNMAYKRRYTSGSVDSFALVTVSGGATFSGIPNGTYVDAVTGDSRTVSNGSLTVDLNAKGNLRVYVLSQSGNPAPGKVGTATTYLK